jgi:hypothetical protein
MKRLARVVAKGLLLLLVAALVYEIVSLHDWGGRIEAALLVFGDRVWVTVDAGRPHFLALLLIPCVLLGAAFSLRAWRSGE